MWKALYLKVKEMFYFLAVTARTTLMLGAPVFQSLFPPSHHSIATPPPETKFRFLKGQAVGKQLPRGEGAKDSKKAHMDPAMCNHPDDKMMQRGNRMNKWWTCELCLSRWQRLDQVEVTNVGTDVHHQDLMTFGTHTGDTYQSVYMNDKGYCNWVYKTIAEDPRTSGGLQRFHKYLEEVALQETWEADEFYDQDVQQGLMMEGVPIDMDL